MEMTSNMKAAELMKTGVSGLRGSSCISSHPLSSVSRMNAERSSGPSIRWTEVFEMSRVACKNEQHGGEAFRSISSLTMLLRLRASMTFSMASRSCVGESSATRTSAFRTTRNAAHSSTRSPGKNRFTNKERRSSNSMN